MNKPQHPDEKTPAPVPALVMDGVAKSFTQGKGGGGGASTANKLHVLRGASLKLNPGEMVALLGPSGSGKSTLLNLAGLLEAPDSGTIAVAGVETGGLSSRRRAQVRQKKIGFVFQFHRLLPEFSAIENIIIPQMLGGLDRNTAATRAGELLGMVGLDARADHRPGELSGGEQQRVAIARAVANAPALLLADEPTGNLDPGTAGDVFRHLAEIIRQANTASLMVTHNHELAKKMDRVLVIKDGVIKDG